MVRLGAFGKAPFASDFIRIGAPDEAFSSFDAWLVSAVERALHAGEDWSQAFRAGATQAFVFRQPGSGGDAALLVGAMAPSRDRAGRQFPLCVAAPVLADPYLRSRPELLPIVLEPIWKTASELVALGLHAQQSDFEQRVVASDATLGSTEDATQTYESWLSQLPAAELWALLYSVEENPVGAGPAPLGALRLLREAIRPISGVERPTTPLSAWLPLGRAGGAAVCFWLDLVRRMAGWQDTIASHFWSHDGTSGKILLHLGEPPKTTAEQLWLPSRSRDEFFDLTKLVQDSQVKELPELSSELVRCAEGAAPLAELLAVVHEN